MALVVREGLPYIAAPAAFGFLLQGIGHLEKAIPFFVISGLCAFFFRDPKRDADFDEDTVVSPADGKIIEKRVVFENRFLKKEVCKVSIFMSLLNAHVNRAPIKGRVKRIIYEKGKFHIASKDKASFENERNLIIFESKSEPILCVQIAGILARRIVCWLKEGDEVFAGKKLGLIKFGSRVDLYLPTSSKVVVELGDKVKAGSTIIGYLR